MSGAILDAAVRELMRRCKAAMALPAKWRKHGHIIYTLAANELEAALGTTPPATDAVEPVAWTPERIASISARLRAAGDDEAAGLIDLMHAAGVQAEQEIIDATPPAGGDDASTPPSRWAANGQPDPHGKQYDCERAALLMGDYTDDELANAVSLHCSGNSIEAIAIPDAAKDRIRWLSRRLASSGGA